ncbi:hypothetical protein [Desulfosporosinus lacus]|uniref:Uncharacterized protein n=1 Tax=Desulfosporosinus lacus DSM 15449 TaxID=1121420 RepID=A0A1M5WG12_9FIRM|nr:hypothetical protein [Desulfosporosinus lacus]SHH86164.1 hypothetical protein SAMN02746098_01591 [Desulfosporosinus lacus DSM 15449]
MSETKSLTIHEAAKIMGKSDQFVRIGLQRGILPFGSAVKLSTKWTYYISPSRFYEYVGKSN